MKLILCRKCQDVRKLGLEDPTSCACGETWGWYHNDGHHATVSANAVVLGLDNHDLVKVLRVADWLPWARGSVPINAFVIGPASTVERSEESMGVALERYQEGDHEQPRPA